MMFVSPSRTGRLWVWAAPVCLLVRGRSVGSLGAVAEPTPVAAGGGRSVGDLSSTRRYGLLWPISALGRQRRALTPVPGGYDLLWSTLCTLVPRPRFPLQAVTECEGGCVAVLRRHGVPRYHP